MNPKRLLGTAKRMARLPFRHAVLDCELPHIYKRAAAAAPVDERKVLFVSQRLGDVPDDFTLLMNRVRAAGFDVRFIALARQGRNAAGYNRACRDLARQIATASVVFLESASPVVGCFPLRPETRVVQLWHACGAFKKWGYSCAEKGFGATRALLDRHPSYGNVCLVPVSSPEVEWAYREAMGLQDRPDAVRALGVSRTDKFFDQGFLLKAAQNLHDAVPEAHGKRVLLYAPTFRGELGSAKAPAQLDVRALRAELGDDWVLVVKHHPLVKALPPIPVDCADFAFDLSRSMNIDELLACADALVTDYSSVIFEYSLMGRPLCFFAYDLRDYDDWRGFYYPYEQMCPGPIVSTTGEVAAFARSVQAGTVDLSDVRAFRNRFMSACDGHATERIFCEIWPVPVSEGADDTLGGTVESEERRPAGLNATDALPSLPARAKAVARRGVMRIAKDYGLGWRIPRAYRQALATPGRFAPGGELDAGAGAVVGGAAGAGDIVPIDPRKVLFVEPTRQELPEAFKVIWARVAQDPAYDARFVSLGKHRLPMPRYLANCQAFAREAATARAIFLCDASDVVSCLPLRPETRVVQLWHACGAFKKFGMSTAELSYGLTRAEIERHPFYENLSLVSVSSPEVVWAYADAMNLVGREQVIQPLGTSRTDVFFDDSFIRNAVEQVWRAVPQAIDKRVVLYAPTFRGTPGRPSAPALPDLDLLRRAIGDDTVVLVKHHPHVRANDRPPIPESCRDFAFDVTGLVSIDDALTVADVLITDYSSVVFEFSLFGRPMAFFAPDLREFSQSRSFYYDFDDMTPGPVFADSAGLADYLARVRDSFDPSEVAAFRRRFMSACDGYATDRILSFALVDPWGERR
ncbi:MAG TPA: hypothetical protein DCP91_01860 [Eggerthellaceae bacterium]|nr:hypothetical protein [Eggerthellaceae bacterium]